jgi:hypothetical protein
MCRATLVKGTADCNSAAAPRAGLLTVAAAYGGTAVYRPSSCTTLVRVRPAEVRVSARRSVLAPTRVRYVATVVARPPGRGVPVGRVEFLAGKTEICAAPLAHETASCTGALQPASYTAKYRPSSADFAPAQVTVGR